jgi:hypothetical protein
MRKIIAIVTLLFYVATITAQVTCYNPSGMDARFNLGAYGVEPANLQYRNYADRVEIDYQAGYRINGAYNFSAGIKDFYIRQLNGGVFENYYKVTVKNYGGKWMGNDFFTFITSQVPCYRVALPSRPEIENGIPSNCDPNGFKIGGCFTDNAITSYISTEQEIYNSTANLISSNQDISFSFVDYHPTFTIGQRFNQPNCSMPTIYAITPNPLDAQYQAFMGIAKATLVFYKACELPPPSNLNTLPVAGQPFAITLSWGTVSGNAGYEVQWATANQAYGPPGSPAQAGAGGGFVLGTGATNIMLQNLVAGVSYKWRIRSKCANGSFGNWSGDNTFPVTGFCNLPAPGNLNIANVPGQPLSKKLMWDHVFGNTNYDFQWAKVNEAYVSNLVTAGNSVILQNLIIGTSYKWHVRARCSNGSTGPWSGDNNFAFLPCLKPSSIVSAFSNIGTSNTISLVWNMPAAATGYRLTMIRLNPDGTQASSNVYTTTTNQIQLSGMAPGTNYRVELYTLCAYGEVSDGPAIHNFYYPNACAAPNSLQINTVNGNFVFIWNCPAQTSPNYDVEVYNGNGTKIEGGFTIIATNWHLVNKAALTASGNYFRVRVRACTGIFGGVSDWARSPNFTNQGTLGRMAAPVISKIVESKGAIFSQQIATDKDTNPASAVVGISEKASTSPNPFSNQLTLTYQAEGNSTSFIQVRNAFGRVLYTSPRQALPKGAAQQYMVNTSTWASGTYLVTTYWGNGKTSTERIVKQ